MRRMSCLLALRPADRCGVASAAAAGATPPLIACLRSSLVGLPDRRGVALCFAQRLSHGLLAGDRRRDLLRDPGAEILELGDADVLHAHIRLRVNARMADVDAVDLVKRGLGEVAGGLLVAGVGVGRVTAARWHARPAQLLARIL